MVHLTKRIRSAIILLMVILFINVDQVFTQYVQDLTVSIRSINKPLHIILDDLGDQTGYYFTFDSRLTDSRRKISIDLADIDIQQAIDTLFQHSHLTYKIINKNIVVFPLNKKIQDLVTDSIPEKEGVLEIKGTIKDERSDKPLPYANIAVFDTYFGTISNEDGSFLLRIPDTLKQTILVASYIGYKNQYTPIGLNSDELVDIKMIKTMISLQEVIIRYQDPVALLSESIKRIKTNYMNEPAGMLAYYREKVHREDKCMVFSEAVVEIAKAPYSSPLTHEKIRLLKGRKLSDIDVQDTVLLKIRSGLSSILNLDIIKNAPDFLSNDFIHKYNLQFSNVVSFQDRLVYVVSFQQKETIEEALFQGYLYIDKETLAILAADFEYDPVRIKRETDMFVIKKSSRIKLIPLSAQYHVEYNQAGNSYYLSQAQGDLKFKIRKRSQWIASRYRITIEMAVTNIEPGNPPDIKFREQLSPASILSEQVFEYDEKFWGDYTTIAPETSLSDALSAIEKSIMEITSPPDPE